MLDAEREVGSGVDASVGIFGRKSVSSIYLRRNMITVLIIEHKRPCPTIPSQTSYKIIKFSPEEKVPHTETKRKKIRRRN